MGKIHRKNQIWLYQKYVQKQQNIKEIHINKKNFSTEEKVGDKERLYILLDTFKYIIPVLIACIGIFLIV